MGWEEAPRVSARQCRNDFCSTRVLWLAVNDSHRQCPATLCCQPHPQWQLRATSVTFTKEHSLAFTFTFAFAFGAASSRVKLIQRLQWPCFTLRSIVVVLLATGMTISRSGQLTSHAYIHTHKHARMCTLWRST